MIDFPKCFDKNASDVLEHAVEIAESMGHYRLGTEHVLISLRQMEDPLTMKLIGDLDMDEVRHAVEKRIGCVSGVLGKVENTTRGMDALLEGMTVYAQDGTLPGIKHLWHEMLSDSRAETAKILASFKGNLQLLKQQLQEAAGDICLPQNAQKHAHVKKNPAAEEGSADKKTASPKAPPIKTGSAEHKSFEAYTRNLVAAAKANELEPLIGREQEIQAIVRILGKKQKNNPILIGDPGVGKSALAEGLAQRIAQGSVPSELANMQVYAMNLTQMISGAKYRGEFEERITNVLKSVVKLGNVILFIDEVHMLVGAGGSEGTLDAANILKPALARGQIRIIGATTSKEYRKYIEKDAALARRFQRVDVCEPTKEQTFEILCGLRRRFEEHHHVCIDEEAMRAAIELSARFITDRFMPDKAIDLIDEAASMARLELCGESKAENGTDAEAAAAIVRAEHIARVVAGWTGIPVERVNPSGACSAEALEEKIAARLVGQEHAVSAVARALRRSMAGLGNPDKPMGVFMLLGPSGVGKTELAKVLSETFFGSGALIRMDMSEYAEEYTVSRLIGSPPGYVGFGDGGLLTNAVLKQPYAVVLFDEIEKAHPKLFNLLLQLFDDGCLTDSVGRKVDFRNTVVIMTSNAGVSFDMDKRLGFGEHLADPGRMMLDHAKRTFRPEFLARIDEMIVMNRLTHEDGCRIAKLMLDRICSRMKKRGVSLSYDKAVLELLSGKGIDSMSGARNLRRVIVDRVEDPVSRILLEKPDVTHIALSAESGDIAVCL